MPPKLTKEQVIEKANARHGAGRYDYSRIVYKGVGEKMEIGCNECEGPNRFFWQRAGDHIYRGAGCPTCGIKSIAEALALTQEKFIEKCHTTWGTELFDYSLAQYKNAKECVRIICNTCLLPFEKTPDAHIHKKQGCPNCLPDFFVKKIEEAGKVWSAKAKALKEDRVDYSRAHYTGVHNFVDFTCKIHNFPYKQSADRHLLQEGCSFCQILSKGEQEVKKCFDDLKLKYTFQFRFPEWRRFPYDFELVASRVLLEFDGIQHFEERSRSGDTLEQRKQRDIQKTLYAISRGYKVMRIAYSEIDDIKRCLVSALATPCIFWCSNNAHYSHISQAVLKQFPGTHEYLIPSFWTG